MQPETLKVYEILKNTWGEKKASLVLSYLENSTAEKVESKLNLESKSFATKDDISRLEILIANKYANTIKWLFLFWVGTIGSVVAIIKFL